ncbi:MAG: beta-L-arabinofuranosidase domain-containing protein [Verrucomicrobiota bacterium]
MKKSALILAFVLAIELSGSTASRAQVGGDQIIDGIGETALAARYVFDGNANDTSRNAQHATVHGSGATFVKDEQFGRVLALPGGNGAYVQIPGRALDGIDTISIAGWILAREAGEGRFFDFGLNARTNFFCVPSGMEIAAGYRVGITQAGVDGATKTVAPAIPLRRWVHLAVVLDPAHKTLTSYLDGKRAAQATGVDLSIERVISPNDGSDNRVFIGAAQDSEAPRLNALIHDVRIYNVALTDKQVAVIHHNALNRDATELVEAATSGQPKQQFTGRGIAQPMASRLIGVSDVTVETLKGDLPRLPYMIPGIYRDQAKGPEVRVIWPSPTNNQQSLTSDVYTVLGRVPGSEFTPKAIVKVKASMKATLPQRALEPFPLGAVTLSRDEHQHETQFIENRDKFIRVLAGTNPDRFLYMFRDAFGQPQPAGAEPLEGWDNQTTRLRGHATGHYLSAIAQAYASTTYDPALHAKFGAKMNYLIDILYELSRKSGEPTNASGPFNPNPNAVPVGPGKNGFDSDLSQQGIRTDYWNWGKGFISAYPPDQFIMLEQGAFYGGGNNQIWAPYYTLHKILAGLLDCYEVGGNKKALVVAEDMAKWVYARLKVVPDETRISMWNRYIAGEYGGMNEVLARLSRLTGDASFLECAKLFDNVDFFFGNAQHTHGLARNVDMLRGKHANQHIPQIIGALETYRDNRQGEYWHVAENFWEICRHSYMYSIGGVAGARNPNNAECFTAQPNSLFGNGFSNGGQNETCATYNLLKLSRELFMFDPDAKYMDYYEQALYNHILASVARDNPGNTYHVPLNPGARKQFGNEKMDGFTCCNGTALESNTKLQDSIYFKAADDRSVYVNLYVPSQLNWTSRSVTLTQQTDFPQADTTKLIVGGGGSFDLKIRVPSWATHGFDVSINGRKQTVKARPGTYLSIDRKWKNGDQIELRMPFGFRLMPVMDQPNLASLFYGPVLLAAEEPEPRSNWRHLTLNGENLAASITGDPHTLRFEADGSRFKPFYQTYGRHSVYLDVTIK